MKPTHKPSNWLLIESPEHASTFYGILKTAPTSYHGIMLRFGSGINPFFFLPDIRRRTLEAGLFIHLRDMNRLALLSIITTAVEAKIKYIFIGDPKPIRDIVPVGPIDGPAFIEAAKNISKEAIIYGTCNRLMHEADQTLLDKYIQAGLKISATPLTHQTTYHKSGFEFWDWSKKIEQDAPEKGTRLIDASHLSDQELWRIW